MVFLRNQLTHMVVQDDTSDDILQDIMFTTTMLLNGMLKGIENSGLSARCLIFFYSKIKDIACTLVYL